MRNGKRERLNEKNGEDEKKGRSRWSTRGDWAAFQPARREYDSRAGEAGYVAGRNRPAAASFRNLRMVWRLERRATRCVRTMGGRWQTMTARTPKHACLTMSLDFAEFSWDSMRPAAATMGTCPFGVHFFAFGVP